MSQQRSAYRLVYKMAMITIIIATLFIGVGHAFAQAEATMQHSTNEGGGGSVTGGTFSLASTIGQADAGKLSGGAFVLTGGFWIPLSLEPTGEIPDSKFVLNLPFVGHK